MITEVFLSKISLFSPIPKQVLILPKHIFLSGFNTELLNLFFQAPLNIDVAPGAPQEKNGGHRKGDAEELSEPQLRWGSSSQPWSVRCVGSTWVVI